MFRFTIRDVLWLTVVVALGLALWLAWRQGRAEIHGLQMAFEQEKVKHEAEAKAAARMHQAELSLLKFRYERELETERASRLVRTKGILLDTWPTPRPAP